MTPCLAFVRLTMFADVDAAFEGANGRGEVPRIMTLHEEARMALMGSQRTILDITALRADPAVDQAPKEPNDTETSLCQRRARFGEAGRALGAPYSRNSSLIPVFERVCASTRLTITAQDRAGPPLAPGREPGTTTA
jgi:hypothetical protein